MTTKHAGCVILCGGESRRMGRPKAWLDFGSETMLTRICRITSSILKPIVVVAAPGQLLPQLPKDVVIRHDQQDQHGPLEGMRQGLSTLEGMGIDRAFVTSTDAPFLQTRLITHLCEQLDDHDIAAPHVRGRIEPLVAVYRTFLHRSITELHESAGPSQLIDRVNTKVISEDELVILDSELASFININGPADYQQALKLWNQLEQSDSV